MKYYIAEIHKSDAFYPFRNKFLHREIEPLELSDSIDEGYGEGWARVYGINATRPLFFRSILIAVEP